MENLSTSAYAYIVYRSFHIVDRTKTAAKCRKMKNDRAKHTKLLFFVVKYANFTRSCSRGRASERVIKQQQNPYLGGWKLTK